MRLVQLPRAPNGHPPGSSRHTSVWGLQRLESNQEHPSPHPVSGSVPGVTIVRPRTLCFPRDDSPGAGQCDQPTTHGLHPRTCEHSLEVNAPTNPKPHKAQQELPPICQHLSQHHPQAPIPSAQTSPPSHPSQSNQRVVGPLFYFDRGLKLAGADLAVDIRRRQPRGFISHAHSDHMARHELAICTPATGALYQLRLGKRVVWELAYRQLRRFGPLELMTYPAGHCLGSAMLWATDGRRSVLYTGDFKLSESATAEAAQLPTAEVLIMETTYGEPCYRHPPRQETLRQLQRLVEKALGQGRPPVFLAYTLGKAQEVTRLLTDLGIPVLQERSIWQVSQVYEQQGVCLGRFEQYPGYWRPGHAVIAPPAFHKPVSLPRLKNALRVAVTGWANGTAATNQRLLARWGAHEALALSDHADFAELLEAVGRVQPKQVFCFHGPDSFVKHLRREGVEAYSLCQPETWPR